MLNRYKMPKRKLYSVTDILVVINSVKHGESQANVSCNNGVPLWTIHGWLRDNEMLNDSVDTIDYTMGWKENNRPNCTNDPQLDMVVFTWFVEKSPADIPILSIQAQKSSSDLHR